MTIKPDYQLVPELKTQTVPLFGENVDSTDFANAPGPPIETRPPAVADDSDWIAKVQRGLADVDADRRTSLEEYLEEAAEDD